MTLEPIVQCARGMTWSLFSVDFDTQEGLFSTYIYALDEAHAIERVEELRASARLSGKVLAFYPAGGQ